MILGDMSIVIIWAFFLCLTFSQFPVIIKGICQILGT